MDDFSGSRWKAQAEAVVAGIRQQTTASSVNGTTSSSTRNFAGGFQPSVVKQYMLNCLVFLSAYMCRIGLAGAEAIHKCCLRRLSPACQRSFRTERHNMVYATVDATSLWIVHHLVRRLTGPVLLHNLIVAVTCMNHWQRLQGVVGTTGLNISMTALEFCTKVASFVSQPETVARARREGVAQGMCGTNRTVIFRFLQKHGLHSYDGDNNQLMAMGLYVEYVGSQCVDGWRDIQNGVPLAQVLEDRFCLVGLSVIQVSRYLELKEARLFDSSKSLFVGEKARAYLGKLLNLSPENSSVPWSQYLNALAEHVQANIETLSRKMLGVTKSDFLLQQWPPPIQSAGHRSLHEHMLCESWKIELRNNKFAYDKNTGMPDVEWRQYVASLKEMVVIC